MSWIKMGYSPIDGPLDPDELAGGFWTDPCDHEETRTNEDGDDVCIVCDKVIWL